MITKLKELLKFSYAPYSDFPVAAILIDKNGKTWNGVNVENAAFPSGICAERSAIFGAISHGFKQNEIIEIHIISKSPEYISPCAGCRQVMTEFMPLDAKVYQYKNNGEYRINTLNELVPFPIIKDQII
ncbi:cytidine deaminase [Mesomycoplasma neurolyticum]|uniref:Cytidine deaminase n=1 Tax=Mesomycoplasma neurolyticum TaxID=2120 RepID=A0A449A4Z2_9BACT|nr:cytidine deaminase [Mesomycoplasma neurolyticum]VEU59233.1 Cytidine deaminase (Cytidine aminohydrolase) [Mesomycoplasma neurolyticum]